jgi:hypothetical protein
LNEDNRRKTTKLNKAINAMEWTNKQKMFKRGPKTLAIFNKDTTSQKKL